MRQGIFLHRSNAASLVFILTILIAGGCATSGVNRGDINLVSIEEEWQLGNKLERDLAQQLKIVNDPALASYVKQLGQQVVQQTEMANLPWEFHVVADPSVNAFNIPGGHVYVHTGLIERADNAAELAGVMAHEISHGVSRHATERLTKAYGINIVASLLLGGDPAIYQKILAQIVATGAIARFSRDAEREADQLGVRYMYQAGYNPIGMATMFEEILSERRRQPSAVEQFFSTHPLTEERIQSVRQQASQLPNRPGLTTREAGFDRARQRAVRYH